MKKQLLALLMFMPVIADAASFSFTGKVSSLQTEAAIPAAPFLSGQSDHMIVRVTLDPGETTNCYSNTAFLGEIGSGLGKMNSVMLLSAKISNLTVRLSGESLDDLPGVCEINKVEVQ